MKKKNFLRKSSAPKIFCVFCVFIVVFSGWCAYIQAQEIKESRSENATLKKVQQEVERLNGKYLLLKKLFSQTLSEREELQKQLLSLENKHSQLSKEKAGLAGGYSEAREEINLLSAKLEKTHSDKTALKKAQQEIKRLNGKYSFIKKRISQVLSGKKELQRQLLSLKNKHSRLSEEKGGLAEGYSEAREEINLLSAKLEKTYDDDNIALKEAQQEIEGLKEENSLAKEKLNEFQVLQARGHKLSKKLRAKDKEKIYRSLGYLYSLDDNLAEAINFYKKALKLNPGDNDVHYNLGYLYTQNGDYKEAVDSYEKALRGDSSDKDIYYNLVIIFGKYLKDEQNANEYYEEFSQY